MTAVEPVGRGFSHFDRLRKIVLDYASEGGFAPTLFTIPAEDLEFASEFDYAFSINVMEHVGDVPGGHPKSPICGHFKIPHLPIDKLSKS